MNESRLVFLTGSGHYGSMSTLSAQAVERRVMVPQTFAKDTQVLESCRWEVGARSAGAKWFQLVGASIKANLEPPKDPLDHEEYEEARAELARVKEAAVKEECPVPSEEIVEEADKLLARMYREAPFPYDVTPEDDGGIAIHAIRDEVYVCVILSADGPDQCFVNMDGERWRSTYTERPKVFGTFLKGALRDLRRYGR